MIFESHAHYDDEAFDIDREELLQQIYESGIKYIVNVGASIKSTESTIELTKKYDFIYGAVGVHPSETAELNVDNFNWLRQQCGQPKVVAVGEIGLDYYWEEPEHDIQKFWFEKQIDLAREVKKPVIIHSREAAKDTMDILKAKHAEKIGGVIHCYSYSPDMAMEYVKMGFYIGIGGVVTFKNGKKIKEVAKEVPIDKILLETDSPYLAPEPNRGKRNSSMNIPYIARQIAEIKGMTYEEVVAQTTINSKKMYNIN